MYFFCDCLCVCFDRVFWSCMHTRLINCMNGKKQSACCHYCYYYWSTKCYYHTATATMLLSSMIMSHERLLFCRTLFVVWRLDFFAGGGRHHRLIHIINDSTSFIWTERMNIKQKRKSLVFFFARFFVQTEINNL